MTETELYKAVMLDLDPDYYLTTSPVNYTTGRIISCIKNKGFDIRIVGYAGQDEWVVTLLDTEVVKFAKAENRSLFVAVCATYYKLSTGKDWNEET